MPFMPKIKCIVIDLDGVVYTGNKLIENADKGIAKLRKKGRVFFTTNNTTLHREEYAKKLVGLGIPATPEEILTSGYVAAVHIKTYYDNPGVYLIGEAGLKRELEEQGIEVCHRNCKLPLGMHNPCGVRYKVAVQSAC